MDSILFPLIGNSLAVGLILVVHVYFALLVIGLISIVLIMDCVSLRGSGGTRDFSLAIIRWLALPTKLNGILGSTAVVLLIGLWGEFAYRLYQIAFWFFIVESALFFSLMLAFNRYRATWDSPARGRHLLWGMVTVLSAICAALIINAIWIFMLNPGRWLETKRTVDALFTPLLLESSLHLLIPSFLNAAVLLFVITYFGRRKSEVHARLNRIFPRVISVLILLDLISALLFYIGIKGTNEYLVKPLPYEQMTQGVGRFPFHIMLGMGGISLLAVILYWVLGYRRGRHILLVLPLTLTLAFVAGAFTRERARKPFLIHSYLTMNMQYPQMQGENAEAEPTMTLPKVKPHSEPEGSRVGQGVYEKYRCAVCHRLKGKGGTLGGGLDGLRGAYDRAALRNYLLSPKTMAMRPFPGSTDELEALVQYLLGL